MLKILFIGDIVGHQAVNLVADTVPLLIRDKAVDYCIANGENCDNGKGINKKLASRLMDSGVDAITGGNHIWQKNSIEVLENPLYKTLRPANYPPGNPGKGHLILQKNNLPGLGLINLQGRSFMNPIDCPFRTGQALCEELRQQTPFIFVDFHAEATAEKLALGWYLDGKASTVAGTHTHVQTADERIFPKGTAYISDVGMTGPFDSVIGMDVDTALERFVQQVPNYYKMATRRMRINAILVTISDNGKAQQIERLNFSKEDYGKL